MTSKTSVTFWIVFSWFGAIAQATWTPAVTSSPIQDPISFFHLSAGRMRPLIVGGDEATPGEFPFIVSLQASRHFCGGSLIASNWILTAAHCVQGGGVRRVVIGAHDLSRLEQAEVFQPKRVIPHPQYNATKTDFDYALIQLDGNSQFPPIRLASENLNEQEFNGNPPLLTVAGWGATKEGSWSTSRRLQKVNVPYVSLADCELSYPGDITSQMLCAGFPEGGKDSCQGDSGGPLVGYQNGDAYLVGVVSWGRGCARPRYYGVYANVAAQWHWIIQETGL